MFIVYTPLHLTSHVYVIIPVVDYKEEDTCSHERNRIRCVCVYVCFVRL